MVGQRRRVEFQGAQSPIVVENPTWRRDRAGRPRSAGPPESVAAAGTSLRTNEWLASPCKAYSWPIRYRKGERPASAGWWRQ